MSARMSASRWFRLLTLLTVVGLLALGASEAQAQVFKPRGKSAAIGRNAPAAARKAAPATAGTTAVSSKAPTRATGPTPRRIVSSQGPVPSRKARKARKGHEDADVVVIDDEDDDDVTITDDD